MRLWDRLRGITRITAINSSWLETQDERLERLETDLEAMKREVQAIKAYEWQRFGQDLT